MLPEKEPELIVSAFVPRLRYPLPAKEAIVGVPDAAERVILPAIVTAAAELKSATTSEPLVTDSAVIVLSAPEANVRLPVPICATVPAPVIVRAGD